MSRAREAAVRETVIRPELKPGEAIGRDGKVIRRQSVTDDGNKYHVPQHIIEAHRAEDYVLQWKRVENVGKEDRPYIAQTARGGWTPVQAERWPGEFLPTEATGAIIVDGLMLMERPMALEREAQREDKALAVNAANAQRNKLGIKNLPAGFEDPNQNGGRELQKARFVKQTVERVDTPAPKYNYSDVALD